MNHKTELFDLESNYKLRIEISVDWENRTILISDNAAGIDAVNYQRAFEPAHIPLDDTGLNEFGMGMKTASVWLANKWCVYTKALGEDVERFTEFDDSRNFALHYLHTLPMYLRRYCLNFEMYYIHWVLMQLTPYLFVSFPSNNKFIAIRFTTSTLTAFPKALNALAIVSGYSANSSIH